MYTRFKGYFVSFFLCVLSKGPSIIATSNIPLQHRRCRRRANLQHDDVARMSLLDGAIRQSSCLPCCSTSQSNNVSSSTGSSCVASSSGGESSSSYETSKMEDKEEDSNVRRAFQNVAIVGTVQRHESSRTTVLAASLLDQGYNVTLFLLITSNKRRRILLSSSSTQLQSNSAKHVRRHIQRHLPCHFASSPLHLSIRYLYIPPPRTTVTMNCSISETSSLPQEHCHATALSDNVKWNHSILDSLPFAIDDEIVYPYGLSCWLRIFLQNEIHFVIWSTQESLMAGLLVTEALQLPSLVWLASPPKLIQHARGASFLPFPPSLEQAWESNNAHNCVVTKKLWSRKNAWQQQCTLRVLWKRIAKWLQHWYQVWTWKTFSFVTYNQMRRRLHLPPVRTLVEAWHTSGTVLVVPKSEIVTVPSGETNLLWTEDASPLLPPCWPCIDTAAIEMDDGSAQILLDYHAPHTLLGLQKMRFLSQALSLARNSLMSWEEDVDFDASGQSHQLKPQLRGILSYRKLNVLHLGKSTDEALMIMPPFFHSLPNLTLLETLAQYQHIVLVMTICHGTENKLFQNDASWLHSYGGPPVLCLDDVWGPDDDETRRSSSAQETVQIVRELTIQILRQNQRGGTTESSKETESAERPTNDVAHLLTSLQKRLARNAALGRRNSMDREVWEAWISLASYHEKEQHPPQNDSFFEKTRQPASAMAWAILFFATAYVILKHSWLAKFLTTALLNRSDYRYHLQEERMDGNYAFRSEPWMVVYHRVVVSATECRRRIPELDRTWYVWKEWVVHQCHKIDAVINGWEIKPSRRPSNEDENHVARKKRHHHKKRH